MFYFRLFPKIEQELENSAKVQLVDISIRSKVLNYLKENNHLTIDTYLIERDERPEEISYELYSSYDYTWTILVLNNVYNIHEDWFLPQKILDKKILREYGSFANAQQTILSYIDEFGYEVSSLDSKIKKRITAFEKIVKENEEKREVKVFSPEIISRIQFDFESNMK